MPSKPKEHRMYDTARWRLMRRSFLNQHPLCTLCAQMGRDTAANTVDHIKPHKGDPVLFWDWDNLQSLCAPCHDSIKRQQERHGFSQAADQNGFPIDEKHPWNRGKEGLCFLKKK